MTTSLFSTNLPECTTNEEIDKLRVKNPHLDTYYLATVVIAERKTLFEECYKIYEPYKDKNFLKEITTRFHQRTWEMYLGVLCLTNGKALKEDRGDDQADLQIVAKPNLINIECTAVTHGDATNPDAVPRMHIATSINHLVFSDVPEEKILLRITQALNDKHKQYQERIADKRVSENEPYIVAINTGEIGYPEHLPRILKAVFGIGDFTLRMRQNGKPVASPTSFWGRRAAIAKTNKKDIDMTFFENDENKGISAVIYSSSTVLNHLVRPEDTDIMLVHNPLAANPIPLGEFSFLTQHYVDKTTGDVVRIEAKR